jgi:sulfide:quinone oxidoreductase
MNAHHSIVIAGGGTAGLTVAARLLNEDPSLDVLIIEPSEWHYYQPIWTLVGAGVVPLEESRRPQREYIPAGATWAQDRVARFEPDQNRVVLESGATVTYDQLVVALGIELHWDAIEGLKGHLGRDGICSNYDYDTVDSTWRFLRDFPGGNAVFTFPTLPIKCAGAPQKIMYLADDWIRKLGVRDRSKVIYAASSPAIFGVAKYRTALEEIVRRKEIDTMFRTHLVAVRPASKEAVFHHLDTGEETVVPYTLLHVVPPQRSPKVVRESALANAEGWVEVDKYRLQHVRYPNVFSLGDNSSLPTSRTGAAVRKEAPVLVQNLLALRGGRPMLASYDGYSSCPLVTGYGKMMLAEFDYDGVPAETFPFDQSRERYSMWALKRWGLPELYWNGMLRGRA